MSHVWFLGTAHDYRC